ncbi:MAG: histidinol-phosphate transaminase [Lachnospiraceae bacterium]|nr:histidinol-phosphate transaminase [Lachnospiraceae bacterium]
MSWEENVRKVVPYTPGEQPRNKNVIKLNTNECPYPPAPGVNKALQEFDVDTLRLYPDPNATVLVDALAEYYGVKSSQVFVGVGSDDVLAMIFMTFFNSKNPIIFPDITYSFYDVWADLFRIPYRQIPLDEDFNIVKEDYMGKGIMEGTPCGGIIFPNPNAPTGVLIGLDFIEDIVKANPDVIVVVDEAYIDFGGVSALPLIQKYDNLLVVQTFSKSRAMAGIRIGYAFGSEKLIKYLNDVKFSFNSYTLNRTALTLGVEAVKDDAYFKEIVGKIVNTREWVKNELKELGFTFRDSQSNFIFATHPDYDVVEIFEELRKRDIYVRHFNGERIKDYLRITIGTDDEMNILIKNIKEIIKC